MDLTEVGRLKLNEFAMAFSEELTLDAGYEIRNIHSNATTDSHFDPPPVPNSSVALLVTLRSEERVVREGSGTSRISSMTTSHWSLGRFKPSVDDSSSWLSSSR